MSDTYDRADNADVGANWLQHIADDANGSNLGISGNRAIAAATKAAAAAYTGGGVIGPNQFATPARPFLPPTNVPDVVPGAVAPPAVAATPLAGTADQIKMPNAPKVPSVPRA